MHTIVLLLAFDPGYTTGFAAALLDLKEDEVTVIDMNPIDLNDGTYERFHLGSPPIPAWERYYNVVYRLLDETIEASQVGMALVTVENFRGGEGGEIQNTVNKLIGQILAATFQLRSERNRDDMVQVGDLKLYDNNTRKRFLDQARRVARQEKNISQHSVDALAHLMHRVEAVLKEISRDDYIQRFQELTWKLSLQ